MDKVTLLKYLGKDIRPFNLSVKNCLTRYLEQHPEDGGITSLYKDTEYILSFMDEAIDSIDALMEEV